MCDKKNNFISRKKEIYNEFFYLRGYYLKISNINQKIKIIIYNMDLLDSIRYKIEMNLNELHLLNKVFKSYNSIDQIYKDFIELIIKNKFEIKRNIMDLILDLTLSDIFHNMFHVEILLKGNKEDNNEYINILISEIKRMRINNTLIRELKEENKKIKNEIQLLKSKISNNSFDKFNTKYNLKIKDKNITELNLSDKNYDNQILKDICNIEFINLKDLYLYNNNINDINPLKKAKFEKLEILYLGGNKISDISVLEKVNFKELKKLYLGNNNIIDISSLSNAKFEKLEILSLGGNQIIDISVFEKANFSLLKELYLFKSNIVNINPLGKAKFENLELLSLSSNQIEDISVLDKICFKKLKKLYLSYNLINDIKPLSNQKFEQLELLYLFNNNINTSKYSSLIEKLKSKIKEFQI